MPVLTLNLQNFEDELKRADRPVLVDFRAEWCGPCRLTAPILDEIAAEHPELIVARCNVDECYPIAAYFGVSGIPAFILFRGLTPAAKTVGSQSKEQLLAALGV